MRLETIISSVARLARCYPLTYGPKAFGLSTLAIYYSILTLLILLQLVNGELGYRGGQASTSIKLPRKTIVNYWNVWFQLRLCRHAHKRVHTYTDK